MAKGTEAKTYITDEILKTFNGAFLNGKEIRIPYMENGEEVQIKVTLTAAKTNVESPNDSAKMIDVKSEVFTADSTPLQEFPVEPSDEEKTRLAELMAQLF